MIYVISENLDLGYKNVSLEFMIDYFNDHELIGFDSETNGLSFMTNNYWCMQFSCPTHQFIVDAKSVNLKSLIKFIESKELIIHNAAFDVTFLYGLGCVNLTVFDTFLAEYVLTMGYFNPGRSLADCVSKYCNEQISKDQRGTIMQYGLRDSDDIEYCAADVRYLHSIREAQLKDAKSKRLTRCLKLENRYVLVLAYIEYCGMKLDEDAWMKRCRRIEYKEYGALLKLEEWAQANGFVEVNWDSPKQVQEIFHSIGIDTFDKKKNKHTVDAKKIAKQSDKFPIIGLYIDYKECNKEVTTYGRNWFDYIQEDGRIHTKYKALVDTARTSSGDTNSGPFPNMQNITATDDSRSCFTAGPRNTLVIGDYSSQESIIMAEFSKEPALLKFFSSGGGDMHAYIAREIYPELKGMDLAEIKEKHADKRKAAKSAGFAIQYGGNGYTIADNMNIPIAQGDAIYDSYFEAFPSLKEYFDKVHADTKRRGYILTNPVTNRKRYIDNIEDLKSPSKEFWDEYMLVKDRGGARYEEMKTELRRRKAMDAVVFRLSLNTPIQSTAADMSKIAGIYILEWIIENKKWNTVKIVNFVHDEYVLECPVKSGQVVADMLKEKMEKAASYFLNLLSIKVDPVISKIWDK